MGAPMKLVGQLRCARGSGCRSGHIEGGEGAERERRAEREDVQKRGRGRERWARHHRHWHRGPQWRRIVEDSKCKADAAQTSRVSRREAAVRAREGGTAFGLT